jgi:hypothetical protein
VRPVDGDDGDPSVDDEAHAARGTLLGVTFGSHGPVIIALFPMSALVSGKRKVDFR